LAERYVASGCITGISAEHFPNGGFLEADPSLSAQTVPTPLRFDRQEPHVPVGSQ